MGSGCLARGRGLADSQPGHGAVRDYSKVAPGFWTGETGRLIRACGRDAHLIAAYAITGPMANPLGLYYLPMPTLCHETGTTLEEAKAALKRLAEIGFCFYDETHEHLWAPEMARYQISETLVPTDLRVKWIKGELLKLRKSRFFKDFIERYGDAFCLGAELRGLAKQADDHDIVGPLEAPTETLPRPLQAPTKP